MEESRMKIFRNKICRGINLFSCGRNMMMCLSLGVVAVISCQQGEDDIVYQAGNPNCLVGNWRAFEFQGGAFDLTRMSDEYDLVTALDPNSADSLVIDNLYDSKIRVKVHFQDSSYAVSHGRQLEVINHGQYGVYAVSVDGEFQHSEADGDYMVMNVGLYDQYAALLDTILIWAFRKTGFEDTDYQSLLSN
jgi:hypothetical protein